MKSGKLDIVAMDFENAGYVSSKIKKLLTLDNVDKGVIRRVSIASYEAEINVVIHSVGGYCEYQFDEQGLTLNYIDFGPGIASIEDAMKEGWSTASQIDRENGFGAGMGFPNMKKAADSLEVVSSPSGTNVKMYFKLRDSNANS